MKNFKRIICLALAVVMVLAMGTIAMAASITVSDEGSYVGYRLLDLKTSSTTGGETNYAYTVNAKYETILQDITGETDSPAIIDYISKLDSAGARAFADAVYRAILTAKLDADATAASSVFADVAQGYWMIADITDGTDAYSLVMLDTAGQEDLTVTPKKDAPSVEKTVYEESIDAYGKVADYDIGDAVPFKLTSAVPDMTGYDSYTITFHDTLSAGLTLNTASVVVTVGGTTLTTIDYTLTTTTNGFDLTMSLLGYTTGDAIVVAYTATLNSGAAIHSGSNQNSVYLEYSNNPYESTSTGETPEDIVYVYTYKLDIFKYTVEKDANDEDIEVPLAGAEFQLLAADKTTPITVSGTGGVYTVDKAGTDVITSPASGKIVINGLDEGTYFLKETTPPDGYNAITEPIVIVITRTLNAATVSDVSYTVDGDEADAVDVLNNTGGELPSTGGIGTTIFYIVGAVLVCGAAAALIFKKKRGTSAESK